MICSKNREFEDKKFRPMPEQYGARVLYLLSQQFLAMSSFLNTPFLAKMLGLH